MARVRKRPTWDELRQLNCLEHNQGQETVNIQTIRKLIEVIRVKSRMNVEIPKDLENKTWWSKSDYDRLSIPELLLESRTINPDELDDDIEKSISKK